MRNLVIGSWKFKGLRSVFPKGSHQEMNLFVPIQLKKSYLLLRSG
jgi:hypothetical protein